jgi:hypothetical protein
MRRHGFILFLWIALLCHRAAAGTYALTDGSSVSGDPINYDVSTGVMLKTGTDTYSDRIPWGKFTDGALRQLRDDTKNPQYKAIVAPMILNYAPAPKEPPVSQITVTAIPTPPPSSGHPGLGALFTSPLAWVMLLILYGTNLFAAYEVALFRNQPLPTVCGLAAIPFLGIASPIFFLVLPSRPLPEDDTTDSGDADNPAAYTPPPVSHAASRTSSARPDDDAPSQSDLPPPVVFERGDFSFNRRFFETKLAGFFRVVLSAADQDQRIHIKAVRGEFVGKRISRITPTELYLEVFKESVTAEEMIPFVEILEVQIRHKDLN